MVDYDGVDFCAVNDAGVLSPDPAQQPVDALLRQRIFGNNEYLLAGKTGVSCSFVAGVTPPADGVPYEGARPWASVDWTCPVVVPVYLEPGDQGVEFGAHISFDDSLFPVGSGFELKAVIADGNQRVIAVSDVVNVTESPGPVLTYEEWNHSIFTAEMQTPYSGPPHYGTAQLWIRSQQIDDSQGAFTPESGSPARVVNLDAVGGAYVSSDLSPPYPAYGKPSAGYIQTADGESSADLLGFIAIDDGAGGYTGQAWLDRELGPSYVLGAIDDIEVHPLTWIQCRSVTIRKFRAPTSVTNLTRGELQAGQAEKGVVSAKQVERSKATYDKRQMIAWGPPGFAAPENNEAGLGDQFPVRWRTVRADATGRESYLCDDTIMIRREAPTLELRALVVCCLHRAINGSEIGAAQFDVQWDLQSISGAGTTWAVSGSTEYTTTERVTLDVYPTLLASTKADAERYLIQREFMLSSRTGTKTLDDWPYAFKDGQLFEEDFKLMSLVSLDLECSGLTVADLGDQLRSLVTVEYVTGTLEGFSRTDNTPADLGYELECTVIGYSVNQRGPNVA